MFYGVIKSNTLVVAAADNLSEFEALSTEREWNKPDILTMIGDSFYSRLSVPPYIIPFDSVDDLADFARVNDILIMGENRLAAKSQTMKKNAAPDPYAFGDRITIEEDNAAIAAGTKVTIASLHGIDKEDRWDWRSDADKKKAEEQKQKNKDKYDDAKARGALSSDGSFAAAAPSAVARATDVLIKLDALGNVEGVNVLAVKGLYADDQWTYAVKEKTVFIVEKSQWEERKSVDDKRLLAPILTNIPDSLTEIAPGVFETEAPIADVRKALEDGGFIFNQELQDQLTGPDADADNDDPSIDPKGNIAIYFKVDVKDAKLVDIVPLLEGAGTNLTNLIRRNYSAGSWIAFIRKSDAAKAVEILIAAGYTAVEYGVDDHGARLLAEDVEGVSVVDTKAPKVYGPRLWNDRAAEIAVMDEDALKEHKKSITADEFIFCGEYKRAGMGTIVHMAPKSYFDEHKEMFPGYLDIGHIMPKDFTEIEPGVFKTMGRDLHNTVSELAFRRKFIESLRLQLYLNNLD